MPNPKYVDELTNLINNSPIAQFLPFRLTSITLDSAAILMETKENHIQPIGTIHGGILATLIDTATYWAAFLKIPEDMGLVNVDLKLNYLRPATVGLLTAEGRCIKPGRSISYSEASVFDQQGKLVAHGTSTLLALQGQGIQLQARKFLND